MPINISNVTQGGLLDSVKNTLLDNNIAAAFGLNSNNDNLLQFHNRFGTNSVFLPDKKTFVIRTLNYFSVGFKFMPDRSKVLNLFGQSLLSKTHEDLKYFVQKVTLPEFKVSNNSEQGSDYMMGSLAGISVVPSNRTFSIEFLNTEFSLHEHCFYYWLKETTSNYWIYSSNDGTWANSGDLNKCMPYTKADIIVAFTSMKTNELLHSIILTDCFPISIKLPNVTQQIESSDIFREVQFAFNNMYIVSPFVGEGWQSKLQSNVIEDVFNSYVGNKISNKISEGISSVSNSFSNSAVGNIVNRQ